MIDAATWNVGDRGYYVLPASSARSQPLYLAVEVTNVTRTRIVVRTVNGRASHRSTKAHSLARTAPEGAWVK